jgi:ABC-2 type transport system permease protein
MIGFLLKDFIRSRSLLAGIAILLLTGLTSIYVGGLFLERQEDTMAQTATAQQESIAHTLSHVADDDLGLFLYYVRFGLVNELPRLAGLSVGHRDVHPAAQNVNIRNLEEQRHVSVLRNPLYQLLGNLDFSFVLVFLFPLVIIAFCFNLFSEEREGGTWSLVLSQAERPELVLQQKLLLRFAAVQLTMLLLLAAAVLYLRIPPDGYLLAFATVAFLYLTFWFSLAWLVVRLGWSSSTNALALLLSWVMLTIVLPGALNALVVSLYPVPEAYEAMLESRDGYHNKWDEAKAPTIARFKEIYPQFAEYEHPEGASFGWFWYYAMQHLGDDEAAPATAAMRKKLERRNSLSAVAGYLFPSVHAQLSFNTLSRTDLRNYLAFQDKLNEFHEAKRLEFYPQIFAENAVSTVDWEVQGTDYFQDARRVNWLAAVLPLLLASGLLLLVSGRVGGAYAVREA